MDIENALYPTRERIESLLADGSDAPVVMLNLLRFRTHAEYDDGRTTDLTGRQAYELYATAMQRVIEQHGGRLSFAGEIDSLVIGEVGDLWDACALVEYPSAAAFATIVMSPEVAEIGVHRAAGLKGQLLIRVSPG